MASLPRDQHPKIQIVDKDDRPLYGGTMDEAQFGGLWHRIARVMVYDTTTDQYLLQMVSPNSYYNGGLWNTTASGHVDEGESYEEAALRETEEEMGLTDIDIFEIDRYQTVQIKGDRTYRRHNVVFMSVVTDQLDVIPGPEVERIQWIKSKKLLELDDTATDGLRRFIDYLKSADISH